MNSVSRLHVHCTSLQDSQMNVSKMHVLLRGHSTLASTYQNFPRSQPKPVADLYATSDCMDDVPAQYSGVWDCVHTALSGLEPYRGILGSGHHSTDDSSRPGVERDRSIGSR